MAEPLEKAKLLLSRCAMGNICHQQCSPCTACYGNDAACDPCCDSRYRDWGAAHGSAAHGSIGGVPICTDFESTVTKVTRDDILYELNRAEEAVFARAFSLFDDSHSGSVPREHLLLRFYIVEHTTLAEESLDSELERACNGTEGVTLEAFCTLMRRGCLKDNESPVRWARVSCSHPSISVLDCRQALEQYVAESFPGESEADVEKILDVVLQKGGLQVSFEDWDVMLQKVARMLRLLRQIHIV